MTRDDLLALVDGARDEIVALCQALVRLPTVSTGVMPTGNETPAAELLQAALAAEGIDANIYARDPARGNLIARLPGSRGTPRLLLLSHTDVVPVEDEAQWRFPPFSATIHEGRIYGRGAGDMKGTVAAQAMTLILLRRAGVRLAGDLIFAAGADEESGGDWGFRWLAEHHADELRADYGLNEGGGGQSRAGRRIANRVQASEKIYVDFTLEATNKGGHSSQPQPENAIYEMTDALSKIGKFAFEVKLNEVTRTYFERMAGLEQGQVAADFKAVAQATPDQAAVARLSAVPLYNAMLRTTCVATMLTAGHAPNALPQKATANVNCRIFPGHNLDDVRQSLVQAIADPTIQVEMPTDVVVSPVSEPRADVMAAIGR